MQLDPCDDGFTCARVMVYGAAILSTICCVLGISACVAPVWMWNYDCDCIPWQGAKFSPEDFNLTDTISFSPWVVGISPSYQFIYNRTTAEIDEDCKISPGLLFWGDFGGDSGFNPCVEGTPLFEEWGYRFCNAQGKYQTPSTVIATQAFAVITVLFTIISALAGFLTPLSGWLVSRVAAVTAILSMIFALTAFLHFISWDYVQDLRSNDEHSIPMLACDQPGLEATVVPIKTRMEYGPTVWLYIVIVVLQFLASISYWYFGEIFGWDEDEDDR